MNTTNKTTTTRGRASKIDISSLWIDAHAEGRAVMTREEFLLKASLARLTERDIQDAISSDVVRRGLTGYWLREAPDPGALVVFANAMIDCMRSRHDARETA